MCYVWGSFVGCVCVFFCGGRGYSFVKPAYTQQVAITQAAMNSTPRGPGVFPKAVGLGWRSPVTSGPCPLFPDAKGSSPADIDQQAPKAQLLDPGWSLGAKK